MARDYAEITPTLRAFIARQSLFFVATAPTDEEGHVNVSPKGLDSLRVLGPRSVVYRDLTGSGNETAAHLSANGRITLMLCSFDAQPRVLRLYGRGRVIGQASAEGRELAELFDPIPGVRQFVAVDVQRLRTSCGFGVPIAEQMTQRDALRRWATAVGDDGLELYRERHNRCSLDGVAISPADE